MASSEQSETKETDVVLYSAMVDAWIASRMEKDKSIFYIASSGIGLLLTLAVSMGPFQWWEFLFYALALILFSATIGLTLWIFHRNSEYLEKVIRTGTKAKDKTLDRLDRAIPIIFGAGIFVSLCIAFSVMYKQTVTKEEYMSQKEQRPLRESINGINRLQPSGETKSLNGIANLKPAAPAEKPATPKPTSNPAPKKD